LSKVVERAARKNSCSVYDAVDAGISLKKGLPGATPDFLEKKQ